MGFATIHENIDYLPVLGVENPFFTLTAPNPDQPEPKVEIPNMSEILKSVRV
jgi:hypothetical protein